MPALSTRLTGDVLRQAVEDATTRDCTPDGRELRTRTTNWAYAAEQLSEAMQVVISDQEIADAIDQYESRHPEENYVYVSWDDAAAALCDAIEARREPDAAPEGDR